MIKFKLICIILLFSLVRIEYCSQISFSVFCFLVSAWPHLSFTSNLLHSAQEDFCVD